jgi:hypothetical protein
MILISHRGNINGRNIEKENHPDYIDETIKLGYDVEIDIWFINGKFWLGHDKPQYKIDHTFLMNKKLWCHAKNLEALLEMKNYIIHYFWHENDTVTLTSEGYIWAHPGKQPIKNSIAVMPEVYDDNINYCVGICSDYIQKYKNENRN